MEDNTINPENGKPVKRSTGWFGRNTIYAPDGNPYMTRTWIGRLRLHVFYRGDLDPDCHDHPWDFWTFPLVSYVEEVAELRRYPAANANWVEHFETRRQIVRAFRLSYRPASHRHRVLGRYAGWVADDFGFIHRLSAGQAEDLSSDRFRVGVDGRKIVTIVWRSKEYREWGFLKHRDGRWCWVAWRDYVFNGGKDAACK